MTTISSLGFDGLNSAGKSTQIALFTEYLDERGISYAIARGDGIRWGRGLKPYDPPSAWWKDNASSLIDKSSDPVGKLNTQYQRLCREALVFRRRLARKAKGNRGILLFDRSFVSRCFTLRQYLPAVALSQTLHAEMSEGHRVQPIIPDMTFVLQLGLPELLRRAALKDGVSDRYRLVQQNLGHYNLWQDVVGECSRWHNVVPIDGEGDAREVHARVRRAYEARVYLF
jgi:thymidylate kinase